jgi:hypothetical protein
VVDLNLKTAINGRLALYPGTSHDISNFPPNTYTGSVSYASSVLESLRTFYSTLVALESESSNIPDAIGSEYSAATFTSTGPMNVLYASGPLAINGTLSFIGSSVNSDDVFVIIAEEAITLAAVAEVNIVLNNIYPRNVFFVSKYANSPSIHISTNPSVFRGMFIGYNSIEIESNTILTGALWNCGIDNSLGSVSFSGAYNTVNMPTY